MWFSFKFSDLQNVWTFPVKVACVFLYSAVVEYFTYRITQYFLTSPEVTGENEVIFFTDQGRKCWLHICNKVPCNDKCALINIRKLMKYIENAKVSLDVCIYTVTNYDLAYCIRDAYRRGVKVRIVTDHNRLAGCGSQINLFMEAGIPVLSQASTHEMHHKFFIVDSSILVNGSFNWTMQAFTGNWENAIVCKEPKIVNVFSQHFNDIWDEFSKSEL